MLWGMAWHSACCSLWVKRMTEGPGQRLAMIPAPVALPSLLLTLKLRGPGGCVVCRFPLVESCAGYVGGMVGEAGYGPKFLELLKAAVDLPLGRLLLLLSAGGAGRGSWAGGERGDSASPGLGGIWANHSAEQIGEESPCFPCVAQTQLRVVCIALLQSEKRLHL